MGQCQHQIIDQTTKEGLFLCVVYKDFFRSCPPKCPYYKVGTRLSFDHLYCENYDIECTYFHNLAQCTASDKQSFICELTQESPDCPHCPLKSSSNPGTNSGLSS
ncbi:MAG: hypothetical protein ACW98F_04940 [Candidatus Hodarchaeales archaeon]|jgi:hypothetical protein